MKTTAIPITSKQGRYRYPVILLRQMVITNFKLRYQGSVLGYLWSLLKPLVMFAILDIVFLRFLKIGNNLPHKQVYLLLGIVLWTFFVEVTSQGIVSIVDSSDLLRKINFPRYVIVLSTAFSALINLAFNMLVIGFFMMLDHVHLSAIALIAPLLILELFFLSLATAYFLSALFVRFRDLSYIWELFLQAAFYATPIIYPLNYVPKQYARWLLLSPLAQIVQDMRYCLVTTQTATGATVLKHLWVQAIPFVIFILLAIGAAYYFNRQSRYFAEDV
ncbi:MAG TPA: ABC transporter permease [Candidatus Saccharimonadia bacterium]|nr:ABC transporter permease [Candidatus Saccharimonadia bacterium]